MLFPLVRDLFWSTVDSDDPRGFHHTLSLRPTSCTAPYITVLVSHMLRLFVTSSRSFVHVHKWGHKRVAVSRWSRRAPSKEPDLSAVAVLSRQKRFGDEKKGVILRPMYFCTRSISSRLFLILRRDVEIPNVKTNSTSPTQAKRTRT